MARWLLGATRSKEGGRSWLQWRCLKVCLPSPRLTLYRKARFCVENCTMIDYTAVLRHTSLRISFQLMSSFGSCVQVQQKKKRQQLQASFEHRVLGLNHSRKKQVSSRFQARGPMQSHQHSHPGRSHPAHSSVKASTTWPPQLLVSVLNFHLLCPPLLLCKV